MPPNDERLLLNQETFRSANEGMLEVVDDNGQKPVPFLCECADFGCLGRLEATAAEYEAAHSSDQRFFILPGHMRMEGEEIESANDRYEIVRKATSTAARSNDDEPG